jgi:hypothetical protein
MDDSEPRPRTSEIRLSSWEDFLQQVAVLESPQRKPWDEIWFRGQSKATWRLDTSLERRWKKTRAVSEYLRVIREIQPAIETFTEGAVLDAGATGLSRAATFALAGRVAEKPDTTKRAVLTPATDARCHVA